MDVGQLLHYPIIEKNPYLIMLASGGVLFMNLGRPQNFGGHAMLDTFFCIYRHPCLTPFLLFFEDVV